MMRKNFQTLNVSSHEICIDSKAKTIHRRSLAHLISTMWSKLTSMVMEIQGHHVGDTSWRGTILSLVFPSQMHNLNQVSRKPKLRDIPQNKWSVLFKAESSQGRQGLQLSRQALHHSPAPKHSSFFVVLGFELRVFTSSHSTSPIFVKGFSRQGLPNYLPGMTLNQDPPDFCLLSN
jgi:hypothetical protein